MTATNELLPFGTGGGALVMSQADYAALGARIAGFSAGIADEYQCNKVWRQASFVAAMIGQFTADQSGHNVLDNGNVATFEANFALAIQAVAGNNFPANGNGFLLNDGAGGLSWSSPRNDFLNAGVFSGTANAIVATCVPTAKTSLDTGTVIVGALSSTNTSTTVTLKADGAAAVSVTAGDGTTPPSIGALQAGHVILFRYTGSVFAALMDLTTGAVINASGGTAYLPLVGGTLTGNLLVAPTGSDPTIELNKVASGRSSVIASRTGANYRWRALLGNSATESGSNVGSDLEIQRFSDAGSFIDTPFSINRATGLVTFNQVPVVSGVSIVPAGLVADFAMSSPPSGWLKANGAAVSRSTYAALYSAIGTTFGAGDGSTTFNLPDLRGNFVRGYDDGAGVDSGRTFGSLQAEAFKSHTHGVVPGLVNGGSPGLDLGGTTAGSGYTIMPSTALTSATGGSETRPRNVALLSCIKY